VQHLKKIKINVLIKKILGAFGRVALSNSTDKVELFMPQPRF
jgi:hypothetical protein